MTFCDKPTPKFWQNVIRHDADWAPAPELLDKVAAGTAICVTGSLIAQTRHCAAKLAASECVCAWATDGLKSWLMAHLFVPHEQSLTASHCVATGRAMLEVGRKAEAIEGRASVCIMVHSHGAFAADFLSYTDVETVEELAADGVCRETRLLRRSTGLVVKSADEPRSAGERRWQVRAAECPGLGVSLATQRADLTPEDVRVEVLTGVQRTVSCFGVVNARGDLFLPTFRRTTCLVCGAALSEELEGRDVELHILGPEELSEQTRLSLDGQLAQMTIRPMSHPSYAPSPRQKPKGRLPQSYRLPELGDTQTDSTGRAGAAYRVWRGGDLIGSIPPALMERVAAQIPEVAACLGWNDPYAAAVRAHEDGEAADALPSSSDEAVAKDGTLPTQ